MIISFYVIDEKYHNLLICQISQFSKATKNAIIQSAAVPSGSLALNSAYFSILCLNER